MAGDWMKIELELPDKPEVHAIAGMLNLDPDCVVGKLIRVWQWFDKHTVDGNAYGVTFLLPDRISGVTGFGEAMSFVGWLEQHDKTLHMPKFDRHTSESAKTRALAAKRQSQYRNKSNDESNAVSVTTPLQREEKRREEINTYTPEFEQFWSAWPSGGRKGGRKPAFAAWKRHKLDGQVNQIIKHVRADISTRDEQFRPAPASYLNKMPWDGWEPASVSNSQFGKKNIV